MILTLLLPAILSAPTLAQKIPGQPEQSFNPFYYFDIQLVQGLTKQEKNNWVISPSSIKTTLGLLLEGASQTTAEEICHILRLPLDLNIARGAMRRLQQNIQRPPDGITVKSGSSILVKQGLGVNSNFRGNAENYFSANLHVSNFSNPGLVTKEVNTWIKSLTNGFIDEIVSEESINPNAVLLLANAIYFKGDWKLEFNPLSTHSDCFYAPECTNVQMMGTTGSFKFGEMRNLNSWIIELPYKNPRYSMVILLPHEKAGLQRTAWDLPFNSIINFLDNLIPVEVDVILPKFSIDYTIGLKPILQQFGVSEMFSEEANFSELFHRGTKAKVSDIVHRAKIEVNEKGTIAAGASVAQFQLLSTNNNKPRFIANRPFFFFVKDTETGFLFEGQLANAQAAQSQAKPLKVREVSDVSPLKLRDSTTVYPMRTVVTKRGGVFTHSYPYNDKNFLG